MRNATILVVRLKGTATEAIKNVVLAGIGKLVIVDGEEVTEEDLGAGFLFRDEDVGKMVRFPLTPPSLISKTRIFNGVFSAGYCLSFFFFFPLCSVIRGLKLPSRELKT